jgi:hypothetical protein
MIGYPVDAALPSEKNSTKGIRRLPGHLMATAACSSAIRNGIFADTGCILQAASRIAAGVAKTNLISGRAHVILAGL